MEARPKELEYLDPFTEWLKSVETLPIWEVIMTRLDRVEMGNFGKRRSVGRGVSELIFGVGPGWRLYFAVSGDRVILLTGGTKGTQRRDIRAAQKLWERFNEG